MSDFKKEFDEIFCSSCGKVIKKQSEVCIHCGVRNEKCNEFKNRFYGSMNVNIGDISPLNRSIVLFLCFILGWLGIHRFYVGKVFTGIFYLLTFGFFGIGVIFDLFLIIIGSFRDKNNKILIYW